MSASSQAATLAAVADQLIEVGRRMDRFNWVPSLGGNISARLDERRIAITRSGVRKGFLTRHDVIVVDLHGRPAVEHDRPSAETLLHCQLYRLRPDTGAVLHGHSVAATVVSRLATGRSIPLTGYEMIKAFEGQTTHETTLPLPLFDNNQDMEQLAVEIEPTLRSGVPAYVLRGHGVYAWGRTIDAAMANLEAAEFLLCCELETLKTAGGANEIPQRA